MVIDIIAQCVITVTGFTSLYLMASQAPRTRMYGGMVGLAGEPFWLLTAYLHEQWGVVALAIVYAVNWYRVVRKNASVL